MVLSCWIPAKGEETGFGHRSAAKATGLACRPLETTVADTLAWWRTQPEATRAKPKAGMPPEREKAALDSSRGKQRA